MGTDVNSGDENAIIQFRDIKLKYSPHVSPNMLKNLTSGYYEDNEIELSLKYANPQDVILELGSGIGAVSSMISKKIRPEKYICVEADPKMAELIAENHMLNGIRCSEVINGVLTHEDRASFDFYVAWDFWASSLVPRESYKEKVQVPALKFNEVMEKYRPTFLICDIEGGEYTLLTKAANLSSIRGICIEIHWASMATAAGFFDDMVRHGFHLVNDSFAPGVMYFERRPDPFWHPLRSRRIDHKIENQRKSLLASNAFYS